MNHNLSSSRNIDLTLKAARSLLSEASQRPWLASLLLHRKQWLIELTQRLSKLSRQTRRLFRRALAVGFSAIAILAATFLWTSPARAGTINVDGSTCTLANAITTANTGANTGGCTGGSGGADTIDLQTDVNLTAALPQITTAITIEGNGHTIQRDDGASNFRILHVSGSGNLTLKKATISKGSSDNGGGIFIESGSATIIDSSISGNSAVGPGGGIRSNTNLTIENSTISGNTSSSWGGGIYTSGNSLTVKNSTISGNSATGNGDGGAIYANMSGGSIAIENSTISGNSSSFPAGGLYIYYGTISIKNSIIAHQTSGWDCNIGPSVIFTSQGYNIESSTSCLFTQSSDQQKVTSENLNLGALADNGGPTFTRALGSGSVAIDKIPTGTNGCTAGTSTDQRGAARANGTNMGGSNCDVGAYEANSTQTPTAVKLRTLAASTRSPAGIIATFATAITAGGMGILGWRRKTK
jgi:hypothetical protein